MSLPLVLVPGMMCDARLFAPQVAAMPERAVTVALPLAADDIAEIARSLLQTAPERFALGGLSLGGIVAMEMVAQAPDRIAGLCLMDTNPMAETAEVAARRGPQMARVAAGGLRDVMRDEMKPNYLADGPRRAAILDLCMEMAEALGPEVFRRQSLALMARPDQQATLRGVTVPSLILCGADDTLCPRHRHETMRDLIPGARLVVVEGAGHLPTLERPGAVNAALRDWLAEVEG